MNLAIAVAVGLVGLVAGYLVVRGRKGISETGGAPESTDPLAGAATGGRQAIDEVLDRAYPAERDHRFGVAAEPGDDGPPLAEIVVFRASTPVPHWHYVTYGLTELGEKDSEDPELSGFGVEYTLRLVDDAADPPVWPLNLLRWLATLVWESREPFDPAHSMDLPEGMLDAVSPGVEGLGFLEDPELGTIATPNGAVTFVAVIPLMAREHWLLGAWDFHKYVDVLIAQQGDTLWRIGRSSVLAGDAAAEIMARVEEEGSSQSVDFAPLSWNEDAIILDEVGRSVLVKFLRYRVAFGRDATIIDGARRTTISPGGWHLESTSDRCDLHVPSEHAAALAEDLLAAHPGQSVFREGAVRFDFE